MKCVEGGVYCPLVCPKVCVTKFFVSAVSCVPPFTTELHTMMHCLGLECLVKGLHCYLQGQGPERINSSEKDCLASEELLTFFVTLQFVCNKPFLMVHHHKPEKPANIFGLLSSFCLLSNPGIGHNKSLRSAPSARHYVFFFSFLPSLFIQLHVCPVLFHIMCDK